MRDYCCQAKKRMYALRIRSLGYLTLESIHQAQVFPLRFALKKQKKIVAFKGRMVCSPKSSQLASTLWQRKLWELSVVALIMREYSRQKSRRVMFLFLRSWQLREAIKRSNCSFQQRMRCSLMTMFPARCLSRSWRNESSEAS